MFDVFGDIKDLVKLSPISIDNNIFSLHYKATMFVLIACSLLVTQKQYFGDPIDCITNEVDNGIMDTYCWIHSTYTLPSITGEVGETIPHPGVGNEYDHNGIQHEKKHHKYYQWVVLVLFLQALMFYIPRYLWTMWEGGKIEMLAANLDSPILDEDMKKERKDMLVKYFSTNLGSHNFYSFRFFACEVMNFVNVIGQLYITDRFLGGEFLKYGTAVIRQSQMPAEVRVDPMNYVFPKMAKCQFQNYGPSGTPQIFDGLCVLPLNVINEKIYIFLWFWFIMVAVATALSLIYRVATIVFAPFRMLLLRIRTPLTSSGSLNDVTHKCAIGDWFLLYQLAKNIDPLMYKEFIKDLALQLSGNGPI